MSYIEESRTDDEDVIYKTKPHWIIFGPVLGWLFLAILILTFGPRYHITNYLIYGGFNGVDVLSLLALIIAFFSAVSAYIRYQTSEFGITTRRILMKIGFIRRQTLEIVLHRVESIQVYQSILGRFLDYGTIIVSGTGGSKDPFPNIPEPLKFRRFAQEQLSERGKNGSL